MKVTVRIEVSCEDVSSHIMERDIDVDCDSHDLSMKRRVVAKMKEALDGFCPKLAEERVIPTLDSLHDHIIRERKAGRPITNLDVEPVALDAIVKELEEARIVTTYREPDDPSRPPVASYGSVHLHKGSEDDWRPVVVA